MIAKSFERIHRSNLVGMGIIPLCFKAGEDADTLGLTGHERYSIDLPNNIKDIRPGQDVAVTTDTGKSFICTVRFDTEVLETLLNSSCFLKTQVFKDVSSLLELTKSWKGFVCFPNSKILDLGLTKWVNFCPSAKKVPQDWPRPNLVIFLPYIFVTVH